jgi:phosphate-selective porin OprO and OprP
VSRCTVKELLNRKVAKLGLFTAWCLLSLSLVVAAQDSNGNSAGADPADQPQKLKTPPDPTIENAIQADEGDESEVVPERQFTSWNQYEGKYITARAGAGLLVDYVAFVQDRESKDQLSLSPDLKLRDFRFLLTGKFPEFERSVTYSFGIMWDAPTRSWLIRQTGIMVALSKTWGSLFIGRTKEGFSLNKVMTGYDGWTMERAPMNDATVPLLADGVKWLGYLPKHGFMWNVGY